MLRYFNFQCQSSSRDISTRPTVSRRHQLEQVEFLEADKVRNLAELNVKLKKKDIPSELLKYDFVNNTPPRLLFIRINILSANCHMEIPRVLTSLSVDEDLQISIHHLGQKMAKSKYKHILDSNRLTNVSQLSNLLTFVISLTLDVQEKDTLAEASTCLKRYLDDAEDENDSARIRMIIKQLKLTRKQKHGRRYSADLKISAFIVYSTSAAAYQSLRNQNMWILPSITTLKRILRKLDSKSRLNNEQYLQLSE